jgi:hypothetical protein
MQQLLKHSFVKPLKITIIPEKVTLNMSGNNISALNSANKELAEGR